MTIRDITEQLNLQGPVKVIKWNGEDCKVLFKTTEFTFEPIKGKCSDMEIEYMYVTNNELVIEVEEHGNN